MESITEEQEREAAQGRGPDENKIVLGRKRFNRGYDLVRKNREEARRVRRFVWLDEQWGVGNAEAIARDQRGQAAITVNEMKGLFHQVANDQRQNRPAPRVIPVDDGADPEVAKVLNGLVRRIMAGSGVGPPADAAFDTAHGHAVDGGEGFFILETDWEDEKGTMQCLRISRVEDPESVILDPEAKEADFSDAMWGFMSTWMDWEVVRDTWPHAKRVNWEEGWGGERSRWENDGMVRVCRYRYVVEKRPENGKGRPKRTVYDCLMTGAEILEETVFPCPYVAMFCVTGDWLRIGGDIYTSGLFHSARGPQMMLNYYRTSLAEAVAEIPKVTWSGTPAMFKNFQKIYKDAAKVPTAILPWNPDPDAPGKEPKRVHYEADVSALVAGGQLMREDIERVTGMFGAARGEETNEKSGKALLARQHETDTATFHYADNLNRAIQYLGRCLVKAIPVVYMGEDPRPTRILEEDGSDRVVYFRENPDDQPIVTEEVTGPADHDTKPLLRKGEKLESGERRVFVFIDPSVGNYDVQIATGPNFSTKRRENAEALLEMAAGALDPVEKLLVHYMLADNLDFDGADLFKEGVLALMPPPLQEVLKGSGGDFDPKQELQRMRVALADAQGQIEQAGQIVQQLAQELQMAQAAANDAERDAMVKVAVAQAQERWQRYEADQATLRTALQQGAETTRARLANQTAVNQPGPGAPNRAAEPDITVGEV